MMDQKAKLKAEVHSALESGAGSPELIEIVRRYKASGLGQRESYDALQDLWLDYGFDDDEQQEENRIRDSLEYVMELVWGFCPAAARIWENSLSTRNQPT